MAAPQTTQAAVLPHPTAVAAAAGQLRPNATLSNAIIYPQVPAAEANPRVRINVMISEFNATLPSRQNRTKFNNGLFHEIQTAIFLVSKGEISHGNQISRGLTAKETAAGLNGNSQLITAPTTAGKSREIDMVCEQVVDGKTRTILVEAKDTQSPDTSQIPGNIALAQQIGALVGIALPASKARQKPSFTDAYNRNPAAQALGPLIFIDVPTDQAEQSFTKQYENGVVAGLASISTADSLSEVRPDTGEEQFAE